MSTPTQDAEPASIAAEIRSFHARLISQQALDAFPDAIAIYRLDGLLFAHNEAFRAFWQMPADHGLLGRLNLFTAQGVAPEHRQALLEVREGQLVRSPVVEIDLRHDPIFEELQHKQLWMETVFSPLRDADGRVAYAMVIFQDRTADMRNQSRIRDVEELVAAQRETIAALQAAQEHIRQQQDTIRELSTPIIEIWPGVLTLPLIGQLDERRASEMTERLLASVTTLRAHHVILDLTGVEHVDRATTDHLLRLLRAVPLLGGQTMIAGIHPDVARTIVELGLDLGSVRVVRNLSSALAEIVGPAPRA